MSSDLSQEPPKVTTTVATDEHNNNITSTAGSDNSSSLLPVSSATTTTTATTTSTTATSTTTTAVPKQHERQDGDWDPTEDSLGISCYMSPNIPGFYAVSKARYSDFIVHEVHIDGTVARLTDQSIRQDHNNANKTNTNHHNRNEQKSDAQNQDTTNPSAIPKKRVRDDNADDDGDDDNVDWTNLALQLQGMIHDKEISTKVMTMLQSHNKKKTKKLKDNDHDDDDHHHHHNEGRNDNDNVKPSKINETACSIEKFVTLPSLEKQQRKAVHEWVRETLYQWARADTVDGNIRIWHVSFEKEMPNYQTFGTSRNRSQNPNRGSNKSSWPEDRPNFLQFVLYKENLDTTTATKELSRMGKKARIGYAGMKDKRGVTTQFCTLYRTEPQQILSLTNANKKTYGGGNSRQKGYSVIQVGNFAYVDKEIRLGMLRGNRFDVVLRNVQGATKEQLEEASAALQKRGFINYFGTQRFGKYKDTHLVGIAVLQGDFRKAIDIVLEPKPDDRPEALKARRAWQNRFQDREESPEVEAECAKQTLKAVTRFMTAENSILQSLLRKPLDYKRAFTCIPKTLRMMFLHAVQSLIWNQVASHRVDAVNREAVVVGDLVRPTDDSEVHVVTDVDLAEKRYSIDDVVLPVIGTKTVLPKNETGELFEKLLKDQGVSLDMFRKLQDRDLAVGGDYRKLVCRPTDVDCQLLDYYDGLQPLIQTDLMKLNRQELTILPRRNEGDKPLMGMIVGFTLPSSSYATMALRELMKRPTSSEYQKELKLES